MYDATTATATIITTQAKGINMKLSRNVQVEVESIKTNYENVDCRKDYTTIFQEQLILLN